MIEQIKYKKIHLYVTGYGIFEGVDNNPSELLVKKIESKMEDIQKKIGNDIIFKHSEVFRVAIQEVNEKTVNLYSKVSENLKNQDEMHLLVHFGVDMGAKEVHLETQCINQFSGNDVDGCSINGKINKECAHDVYKCRIDLASICSELKKSHKVDLSNDAGDYLCNFVYFLSSNKWKDYSSVHSVFIHVPAEETLSVDQVYSCFVDFLSCVKKKYLIDN